MTRWRSAHNRARRKAWKSQFEAVVVLKPGQRMVIPRSMVGKSIRLNIGTYPLPAIGHMSIEDAAYTLGDRTHLSLVRHPLP